MPADHHQHHGARLKREMCACVCVWYSGNAICNDSSSKEA